MTNNINIENIKKNIEQLKQDLTSFKKEYLSKDSILVTDNCLKNGINPEEKEAVLKYLEEKS